MLDFYSSLPPSVAARVDKKYHSVEIEEGTTIPKLFAQLKIPIEEAGLVILNGTVTREDKVLHDGDLLGIIPVVYGG